MTAPRIGALGVGWIGRSRIEAIANSGAAHVVAVVDPASQAAAEVAGEVGARVAGSYKEMLDDDLDGVVIATPSALHARQAIEALEHGVAVFCQKPLGRTAQETRSVVAAAERADRLLGVDLSYRYSEAAGRLKQQVDGGTLGPIYAIDLVFHNAYGPDKPWFLDPARSGGGCVIDLGIHMIDLALWVLGDVAVDRVRSRLFAQGVPLVDPEIHVEDHALVEMDLSNGAVARLACSWYLNAGRDAVIEATFNGTQAAVGMRNVGGSFYDLEARLNRGTGSLVLAAPPDPWPGRAAVEWANRLAADPRFDPGITDIAAVATVVDRIYGRA